MATLLLDELGRPIPQYMQSDSTGFEAAQGTGGALHVIEQEPLRKNIAMAGTDLTVPVVLMYPGSRAGIAPINAEGFLVRTEAPLHISTHKGVQYTGPVTLDAIKGTQVVHTGIFNTKDAVVLLSDATGIASLTIAMRYQGIQYKLHEIGLSQTGPVAVPLKIDLDVQVEIVLSLVGMEEQSMTTTVILVTKEV